jgi:beta-phosphoglucomutase-like phosphatase (HAD superfamily)
VLSLLADESIGQGQSVDGFIQTITEEKIASTIEQFKDHVDFFEDTLLFLNKIREGNVALKGISEIGPHPILAITTGLETPLLNQILQYHDLSNIISVIVTAEQYTHSKPHPECYQMTLNRMGCSPDEIIGIEDAPSGIRALNAAGIRSIAVANTHEKSELHEAYITVDRLVDLIV